MADEGIAHDRAANLSGTSEELKEQYRAMAIKHLEAALDELKEVRKLDAKTTYPDQWLWYYLLGNQLSGRMSKETGKERQTTYDKALAALKSARDLAPGNFRENIAAVIAELERKKN